VPDPGMDVPLRSESDETEEEAEPTEESEDSSATETEAAPARPARPPPPSFKPSTMILTFLFLLGILMIFDNSLRNQVALLIGYGLAPLIGFADHYILLTMFLAAVIEMGLTAVAYNYTTDWVKAARVQKWSSAFRKEQMAALKSGKKDKMEALKVKQQELTKLTSEMSINQLKGMAVTWFLVIAIYTWVGLFVACGTMGSPVVPASWACTATGNIVTIGGNVVSLMHKEWIVPLWFLIFSLYTIPSSLILRRYLKHYSLLKYAKSLEPPPPGGVTPST
jgi:uncharacterized membrane protein (DUF106 family)